MSIIDEEELIMIIVMNVFVAVFLVFLAPIENVKCLNIDINEIIFVTLKKNITILSYFLAHLLALRMFQSTQPYLQVFWLAELGL